MLKKLSEKGMECFSLLLEKVENGLSKMQSIIHELTYSREKEHRYEAVEELLNIEHILEDVRLTLAVQIAESSAVIKSDIGVSEIVFIRRKLRSILYNLINNAIKYSDPDRRTEILIFSSLEDGYMVIGVTDNGLGIAEADLDKIFVRYQRVASSVEGTGVGLYLVREIVNASGGRVSVERELGKGSTFKVYLKMAG